jgi:hypothetical protein
LPEFVSRARAPPRRSSERESAEDALAALDAASEAMRVALADPRRAAASRARLLDTPLPLSATQQVLGCVWPSAACAMPRRRRGRAASPATRLRRAARAGLADLPCEVLISIAALLPAFERLSLASTCRACW